MEGYTSILRAAMPEVKTEQAELLVNRYRVLGELGAGGLESLPRPTRSPTKKSPSKIFNQGEQSTVAGHKPCHAGQHVCGGLDQ